MKAFCFCCILTVCTINLFSQETSFPVDANTGRLLYSEVVRVDSVNSQELYVRAHSWIARSFNSASNVIQLDDKAAGMIVVKGVFAVKDNVVNPTMMDVSLSGTVDFTLEIQTRDGRYKYIITDLVFKLLGQREYDLRSSTISVGGFYKTKTNMRWLELRQNTDATILRIIESLRQAMTTSEEW